MNRRSLVRFAAITLGIAVAVGPAVSVTASAQPGSPPAAPDVVQRHTITLITGDVVDLQVLSTGDALTTVTPAGGRTDTGYATRKIGDALYLVPNAAQPLLAAGKLDPELFNLNALVANGSDDPRSPATSVIVQYEPAHAMTPLTATTVRLTLESINAVSVVEDTRHAGSLWAGLGGTAPGVTTALTGSVRKIWLNRTMRATLTESVPRVGAPAAWAGGHDGTGTTIAVLDTGIDATHPDLDGGKVIAAANFSSDSDSLDHFGHGTHVASIASGTGEAAPAARRGVAPSARLLNAKVLNSAGRGSMDQVIEGLEWAAAQGADVANLSLGFQTSTEGPDLLTEAVDAISRSSGMLVVASAGNLGDAESTLVSPGTADEALTVGAVDKQDALAEFSSRGPRLGDYAVKPDITAPGTDIIAARATGTQLGPIVDETYQQLRGTSMAAPHVAGAAAILAQRFPGRTGRQLKDMLISTATTSAAHTVYEQGGGHLDLARAYGQQVYASPGTVNVGVVAWPHAGQPPVTRTVSYTNDTAADITLELSLAMSGRQTGPAPGDMFTMSAPNVTVPAHGTASVTVAVNRSAGPPDLYGGYLVGRAGKVVVHSSVGAYVEPEMHTLTVSGIARDGRPAALRSSAQLWNLDTADFAERPFTPTSSTVTFRVPPGTYNLVGFLGTADAADAYLVGMAVVAHPQLEITRDQHITLDARRANEIIPKPRDPVAPTQLALAYHRDAAGGNMHSAVSFDSRTRHVFAAPTAPVTNGNFEFYSRWRLVAPPLRITVVTAPAITLEPVFLAHSPQVDDESTRSLLDAGAGRPQDYAGRPAHGRIVLIQRTQGIAFSEQIGNAARAGASAALIVNDRPGLLVGDAGAAGTVPIPAFGIEQGPGTALRDLLRHRAVWLRVSGTSVSPYVYDLLLPEKQRIPGSLVYPIDRTNTAQIDTRYFADAPGDRGSDRRHIRRPYPMWSFDDTHTVPRPTRRTEYVSANDTLWLHVVTPTASFAGEMRGGFVRYEPRARLSESWFGRVTRPGSSARSGVEVSRTDDRFRWAIYPFVDTDGHYGFDTAGDALSSKLYAGDRLLKETSSYPSGSWPALPEPAVYRFTFTAKRSAPWSRYSTETNTTWTFASRRPAAGHPERPPLPRVDYHLPLDQYNQAAAGRPYLFTIDTGYVPGASGPERMRVQAWASFNDGAGWTRLVLWNLGNGKRLVLVWHPRVENTSGAVSLRVTATDIAGNSVDQTIYRAYGLHRGVS